MAAAIGERIEFCSSFSIIRFLSSRSATDLCSPGSRSGNPGAGVALKLLARADPTKLDKPRAMWIMVPTCVVASTLEQLKPLLEADDIVIDGGNSYYRDDIPRAKDLKRDGIHFIDVGTSGGVWGLERGYCLMIGGEDEPVQRLNPIFFDHRARQGQRRAHPGLAARGSP